MDSLHLVTTMTPLRVSFAGGGTDMPSFFRHMTGHVVSMTIKQFIYVTVKRHSPLFGERYRVSYSETEHVDSISDIKNGIVRECLRLLDIDEPLFISTSSDIPGMSGLGSSSSFAVGLLNALHLMRGEIVSAGQLAEEACEVEIHRLAKPIGKQDQYAAAFGGLNSLVFHRDGRVSLDAITLAPDYLELMNSLVMVWVGTPRRAEDILQEQNQRIPENLSKLGELVALSDRFKEMLIKGPMSLQDLSQALTSAWLIKRELASTIATPDIDFMYAQCVESGALGGKLLGAGGGGFLLMCVPTGQRHKFAQRISPSKIVSVSLEPHGSRILSNVTS